MTWRQGGLFDDTIRDGDSPAWRVEDRRYLPTRQRQTIITGGAAGNHTVTGIGVKDRLLAIQRLVGAGVTITDIADLTSEFTITAPNTINNTGGTNTTGDKLVIWWQDRTP